MSQPDPVVIYGEVLFDQFEDGSSVLGGAPFNVAWHLNAFGAYPLLVSRIGQDNQGQAILAAMHEWQMDRRGVQIDAQKPTGTVSVFHRDGLPDYEILPDQAYDHLNEKIINSALADYSPQLLYHGSLITRAEPSRSSLYHLRDQTNWPVFMDVNLRKPWWDVEAVRADMQKSRWVKLNDQELALLMYEETIEHADIRRVGQQVCRDFELECLIITLGDKGAWLITAQEAYFGEPVEVTDLVDTVGAGDAFSAVTILGILHGWPHQRTLPRAQEFAAQICRYRGATPKDKQLYEHMRARWDL